ncbi:MAG: OmpA family protein [Ferruginibacter sp.]
MKIIVALLLSFCAYVASAQSYRLEGNEVKMDQSVSFEPGTAILKPESDAAFQILKKYLDDKSYISLLRIECHTDNSGSPVQNQELSEKRAMAVCAALVKMGVDCKRLLPVGFGGNKPVADNSTPDGKAANRRVSFMNAALKDRPIGGLPVDGGGKVAGESCK